MVLMKRKSPPNARLKFVIIIFVFDFNASVTFISLNFNLHELQGLVKDDMIHAFK